MSLLPSNAHVARRSFLAGAAAATAGLAGLSASEAAADTAGPRRPGRQRDLLVQGATVLTMDPDLGDLTDADIHVADGRIAAVGPSLSAPGAKRMDARGMIAIPGLVETHWHMWTGIAKATTTGGQSGGYLSLLRDLGPAYRPEDTYAAVALSLAEAASSGITTVHDWSHNLRGPEWADASLRAHSESGLRARFSYGTPQGIAAGQPLDLADVTRVRDEWIETCKAPLTRLGIAVRGPDASEPSAYRREWQGARDLGLPITLHAQPRSNNGLIQRLGSEGLLGPDVQLVHAVYADQADRDLMARSGSTLSVSPASELLFGWGPPQTVQMLDAGVRVSLSVDNTALVGRADGFEIMRLALGLAATAATAELSFAPRRVLELATIDGARELGMDDVTGSLTPGKQADLILVRADGIGTGPATDPVSTVVRAAGPGDVDTVVVAGHVLKRNGQLVRADGERIVRAAAASLAAVRRRARQ